jgi:hypothetical protein
MCALGSFSNVEARKVARWRGTGSGLEFRTPALRANQRERSETICLERFKEN